MFGFGGGVSRADYSLNTPFNFSYCSDKKEVMAFFYNIFDRFTRDILAPYSIADDALSSGGGYDALNANIGKLKATPFDIMQSYFFELSATYVRINFEGVEVITKADIANDGLVWLTIADGTKKNYEPIKAYTVLGRLNDALYYQLERLFNMYNYVYHAMQLNTKITTKPVVTINGLNDISRSTQDRATALEEKAELYNQLRNIFNRQVGVLDSSVKIEMLMSDLSGVKNTIEFLDNEFVKLMGIPQTVYLGTAPQGMNATGEYDFKAYEEFKDGHRRQSIEPALNALGVNYTKKAIIDINLLNSAMQGLAMASEAGLNDTEIELIKTKVMESFIYGA